MKINQLLKYLPILLFFATILKTQAQCIDPTLIEPNGICTLEYFPVCGCNGVTYDNPCLAKKQGGVTSYTPGACGTQPQCIDSSLINPDIFCPAIYDPVCGCNGITYGNSCEATNFGGVTSYTPGECGGGGNCKAIIAIKDSMGVLYLTDQSIGNNITTWQWTYDNQIVSTTQNTEIEVGMLPVITLHNICLQITDQQGCTNQACTEYAPLGCYLYPSFTYTQQSNTLTFSFTSTSIGLPQPSTFQYTFGDGALTGNQNPTHTYAQEGTYQVCLSVNSPFQACSQSPQYCQTIDVKLTNASPIIAPQNPTQIISIYPNLITNALHIKLQNASPNATYALAVYNTQGKIQYITNIKNTELSEINTQNWATGTYFVVLKNEQNTPLATQKIIKY